MSVVAELLYSRRVPQVAVLALISLSFAGCSADMQSRLSQQNFSNPFSSEQTGSVQQAPPLSAGDPGDVRGTNVLQLPTPAPRGIFPSLAGSGF